MLICVNHFVNKSFFLKVFIIYKKTNLNLSYKLTKSTAFFALKYRFAIPQNLAFVKHLLPFQKKQFYYVFIFKYIYFGSYNIIKYNLRKGKCNMKDVNINNNIDNSTINGNVNIHVGETNYRHQTNCMNVDAKKTDIKGLIKSQLKRILISGVSSILAGIIEVFSKNFSLESKISLIIAVSCLIIIVAGILFFTCFLYELIQVLKLKETGKCINFQSKIEWIRYFIEAIQGNNATHKEKRIGRLFKNEDGQIYEIQGCKCPICESEPIGYMRPSFKTNGQYIFECSENYQHRLTFDYKRKIIK